MIPDTSQSAYPHKRDWVKAGLLLALGVYFVLLLLTGAINNYINQRFQWLVIVGAVLFVLFGLWQLKQLLGEHAYSTRESHTQEPLTWKTLAIVAIPLILAVIFPSRPLGAEAINGGVSFAPVGVGDSATFNRLPQERNILDWLREFNRVNSPASFNGQPVDVIGFIYREPYMAENEFMLARFTMSCCVADAFAIGMPVFLEGASEWETGAWVRITGTLEAGTFNGETLPIIRPTTVEPTEIPATPYLYS